MTEGISIPTKEQKLSSREIARSTLPIICYAAEKSPPEKGGEKFYEDLRTAPTDTEKETILVSSLTILAWDA